MNTGQLQTDLIALIKENLTPKRGVRFVIGNDASYFVSWEELFERASKAARRLRTLGIGEKDRVALLSSTSPELVELILGCWINRTTVIVLPLPLRLGSIERFRQGTINRIKGGRVARIFISSELAAFVSPEDLPVACTVVEELEAVPPAEDDPEEIRDFLAIIQFTSGSTAEPKGVMVPSPHVAYHVQAIAEGADFDAEEDRVVSWLPLYHDMGLIGLLTVPMAFGADLVLSRPQDFVADPLSWMRLISEFKGTATAGPNFAYALSARALSRASGLDLSSLRLALNGAEMIDPALVRKFVEAAGAFAMPATAPFCAYGMAEATLAISFPEPGSGLEVDVVDKKALEEEGLARPGTGGKRELAKLGKPLRGIALRIKSQDGSSILGEREIGEIQIAGLTVTPGYFDNEEATREAFDGEWLKTGDLGYVADGQVVVCGRIKDIIKVGGRTIYPEDIERAVGDLPGVRAGNVIAFSALSSRGRERVVVVAEVREERPASLKRDIATTVVEVAGVPAEDVVLVRAGTLPKTSSGKLQRTACKDMYRAGELEKV